MIFVNFARLQKSFIDFGIIFVCTNSITTVSTNSMPHLIY
ncbi:hypothetical protein LEP1GSC172_1358 [Leptospira noguchii]|uniref:Uncharacterized protein n=1 Tax=Leptospira noguchii TaxID=28182 RepID=M6VKD4_9LEPT|nr:hypothetical protein LEP1GSC172_1358 [Leptospira noguchii]